MAMTPELLYNEIPSDYLSMGGPSLPDWFSSRNSGIAMHLATLVLLHTLLPPQRRSLAVIATCDLNV